MTVLEVDRTVPISEYRKDPTGKKINKFLLALDKSLKHFKHLAGPTISYNNGRVNFLIADRGLIGGQTIGTTAVFGRGYLYLEDKAYNNVRELFTNGFTLDIEDFIEINKNKTKNPVYKLEVVDQEYIAFTTLSPVEGSDKLYKKTYKFPYDGTLEEESWEEYAEYYNRPNGESLTPVEPIYLDETYMDDLERIRNLNSVDLIKLRINLQDRTLRALEYFDPELGSEEDHIIDLDLCKKYLAGFQATKKTKKELEANSDYTHKTSIMAVEIVRVDADDSHFKHNIIDLSLINDTHVVEQTFITLSI